MIQIKKGIGVEELAAIVTQHLESKGMSAVMVGGSVVSIYTNNEYKSKDIDFISPDDHREIKRSMEDLGFTSKGKDFYHPNSEFTIEFPSGPLGIGDDVPMEAEGRLEVNGIQIKLFSPTQSVMDRLASFYFYNDRQCLDQAVMICKNQVVNFDRVREWSLREGEKEKYEVFQRSLKK